jgi:hypothetical protein
MVCEHDVSLQKLCVRCDIEGKQWKLDEALASARQAGYDAARPPAMSKRESQYPVEVKLGDTIYCLTVEQAERLADGILCQVYALQSDVLLTDDVPAPRSRQRKKGAKKR